MGVFIIIFLTALGALFSGVYGSMKFARYVAIFGVILALVCSYFPELAFFHQYDLMVKFDLNAALYTRIALFLTLLIFILGDFALINHSSHASEMYALILFSLCGAILLFSFTNLIMVFLGIEILSIPLYVLAGSRKNDLRSNEASLKYFLMGSFATGFLLLGIAFVYGSTGQLDLHMIQSNLEGLKNNAGNSSMALVGILLILSAFAFKVSLVPFHMWSPDVYQGSPSWVTAFMSTVVKMAGFYGLYRMFSISFLQFAPTWLTVVGVLLIITLILANVMGLAQSNSKRMLAYSSISHAGYLALIFFGNNISSAQNLAFYLLAYGLANIAVFTALIYVEKTKGETSFGAFSGLSKNTSLLSFAALVGMFSMAGIPLTAGFIGKFLLFSQAINGAAYLVFIAIIGSTLSIAYYLRLGMMMYFRPQVEDAVHVKTPFTYSFVALVALAGILILGIFPDAFQIFNAGFINLK